MPKVTEAHLEARRQQIVDAACVCFARKGFHPTTMQEICRQAELSPGAVYRYFESKEDIIIAACAAGQAQDLIAAMTTDPGAPTAQVLRELVDAFVLPLGEPGMRDQIVASLQIWAEMAVNPAVRAVGAEGAQETHRSLAGFVTQAQERGDIAPALDPSAVADAMDALYHGMFVKMTTVPQTDVKAYAEVLKALLTGGFWTGPAARA